MNDSKGFTLVELLAVIAILAILVIIALPNVMGMFNSAKESTFITELKKLYRGAEEKYVSDAFNTSGTKIYSKCSGCTNELDMQVRDDLEYYIEVDSTGKIVKYYARDNSYQFSYDGEMSINDIDKVEVIGNLDAENIINIADIFKESNAEMATSFIKKIVDGSDDTLIDVIDKGTSEDGSCTYTLAYDLTEDNSLRYVGNNPCNYVRFNDELWRIVGVINNVSNGNGKTEQRIKIVRNDSIGKYSYDSSSEDVNGGFGVGEWSQSKLKNLLNDLYYNSSSGECYVGSKLTKEACDFSNVGLKSKAKNMIEDALWYTGPLPVYFSQMNSNRTLNVDQIYEKEKHGRFIFSSGASTYSNDTVERTTSWVGKVGLISASDWGYSTSGKDSATRKTCIYSVGEYYAPGSAWNSYTGWENNSYCPNNTWYKAFAYDTSSWVITSISSKYQGVSLFQSGSKGTSAYLQKYVYPSVYLKSSVKITSGDGTISNPYILK